MNSSLLVTRVFSRIGRSEIVGAQRLRYQVFAEEQGAWLQTGRTASMKIASTPVAIT
jgi:hypothetical protein